MASSKEIRDRVFAMSGAILFFVTSIALTVVVIVQIVTENKQKKEDAAATTSSTASKEGKLVGTKRDGFTPITELSSDTTTSTDSTVGTGAEVTSAENTVTVDYTGWLASNGTIFDSSLDRGEPISFKLNGVIVGWQKGMIGMKEGGVRRLVIPAAEAYGAQSTDTIPANSNLVFDITLKKVE